MHRWITGVNVAGAIRLAKELGPGHTIVTLLCDYGTRYQSKLFDPAFLKSKNLPVPRWLVSSPAALPRCSRRPIRPGKPCGACGEGCLSVGARGTTSAHPSCPLPAGDQGAQPPQIALGAVSTFRG